MQAAGGSSEALLTQQELCELIDYDPETGIVWRKYLRRRREIKARSGPYIYIGLKKRAVPLHRAIWLFMTGEWPVCIDHINGVGTDNRWSNLRKATRHENMRNQRLSKRNPYGLKGITWDGDRSLWAAQIHVNRKHIYLGRYETKEEAHLAYCRAARAHFGEFARSA